MTDLNQNSKNKTVQLNRTNLYEQNFDKISVLWYGELDSNNKTYYISRGFLKKEEFVIFYSNIEDEL